MLKICFYGLLLVIVVPLLAMGIVATWQEIQETQPLWTIRVTYSGPAAAENTRGVREALVLAVTYTTAGEGGGKSFDEIVSLLMRHSDQFVERIERGEPREGPPGTFSQAVAVGIRPHRLLTIMKDQGLAVLGPEKLSIPRSENAISVSSEGSADAFLYRWRTSSEYVYKQLRKRFPGLSHALPDAKTTAWVLFEIGLCAFPCLLLIALVSSSYHQEAYPGSRRWLFIVALLPVLAVVAWNWQFGGIPYSTPLLALILMALLMQIEYICPVCGGWMMLGNKAFENWEKNPRNIGKTRGDCPLCGYTYKKYSLPRKRR
jgi:hypothetical protein